MIPAVFRDLRVLALAIWFAAELVLQIHGVRFWSAHGGWQGWMWSLVLGAVAVWFWLLPMAWQRWPLGLAASLLLLAGPLWEVGAPLVEAAHQAQAEQVARAARIEMLQRTVSELETAHATYVGNTERRAGWVPVIERNRAALERARTDLAALLAARPTRPAWLSLAVVWLQLAALGLFQVAAIMAIGVLRRAGGLQRPVATPATLCATAATPATEPPAHTAPAPLSPIERVIRRVAGGHYGTRPGVRQVMAGEGVRHPVAKQAFAALEAQGVLRRTAQGFELIKATEPT